MIRETENDDLTDVLEELIKQYAVQVSPYATELATQLVCSAAVNILLYRRGFVCTCTFVCLVFVCICLLCTVACLLISFCVFFCFFVC